MSATLTGGCYCGAVRYRVTAPPKVFGECHCRACQYISGGGPNYFLMVDGAGFAYTQGDVRQFARPDLETPRIRDFCPTCGTHLLTRPPGRTDVIVKVGTLDDPAAAGKVGFVIHCAEAPPFHQFAEGTEHHATRP